jgi:hypothetical protein
MARKRGQVKKSRENIVVDGRTGGRVTGEHGIDKRAVVGFAVEHVESYCI